MVYILAKSETDFEVFDYVIFASYVRNVFILNKCMFFPSMGVTDVYSE